MKIAKKIIFTDLDRTLLRDDETLSERNRQALLKLRKEKIMVVIATGRNIFSAKKVLSADFPADFLIFSSGLGIIDWSNQKIIFENHLNKLEIQSVLKILFHHRVDFMLHNIAAENHKFYFWKENDLNPDFAARMELYSSFAKPLILPFKEEKASQFIVILKPQSEKKFERIKSEIRFLKVIRATSPLDHKSIWLEIFPNGVSKGQTANRLCDFLQIKRQNTVGIGNDYNDIDLLNWTAQSFVVTNSPEVLKQKYETVKSNEEDGFAEVAEKMIKENKTRISADETDELG